jgi:hypothetical protein
MLMKLTTLAKGKVAAAVLGVILVGGGGGAVAVAATQGHLNGLGLQMSSKNDSTETPGANPKAGSHAEGMLTACDTSASTIGVTDEKGAVYAFTVTADTKFNGDIHGNNKGGSSDKGNSSDKGGNSSNGGASTTAFGLTDLCPLVNKVKVQVQATASTSGSTTTYNADKITVEGPGTGDNTNAGSGDNSSDGQGKPESTETPEAQHDFTGSVVAVTGTSFTMTVNGVQYTVDASNAKFDGGSLAALTAGVRVQVEGTLSGTTITAWSVEVKSSGSGSGGGDSSGGSSSDH